MIVALDAMGGDFAPEVTVDGAIEALRTEGDLEVVLVGNADTLQQRLNGNGNSRLTIRQASEVVQMTEPAALAVRKKRDSSIRVAVDMVKNGEANAVVSAGHSGVAMTTSFLRLGKAAGVDRPAIGVIMPKQRGFFLLIDGGANVDCKPINLLQFAHMGSIHLKTVLSMENPKVGILSIGEEDTKGNGLTKEAFKLLKASNLNFIGNIEGKDLFHGAADVVVCDGFIGNTVLKLSEGLIETMMSMLKEEISSLFTGKLAYLLMKPAIRNFKKRTDYDEYGGAPLLGINGTCIISHGRSSAKAICNALKVANTLAKRELHKKISEELANTNYLVKEKDFVES